jgi:hypothetical protein
MSRLIRTIPELVEAYRDRIRELDITFETVDSISGLPDRYTQKLMGPTPLKGLGEKAIRGLNRALGVSLVLVEDSAQAALVRDKWQKRKRPQRLPAPAGLDVGITETLGGPQAIPVEAENPASD